MDGVTALLQTLQNSPLAERVHISTDDEYNASLESYFSSQEQGLHPAAIVVPQNVQEVAEIIRHITPYHTSRQPFFAVRSGGQHPRPSSANIQDGITIDLSVMKHVSMSADRSSVTIGSGARWGDVYSILDKEGLGIGGGRNSTLGVGGLTLGGGISFFSPQRGFVCDDVVNFEIVLADGSVVNASENSHQDLWRALKGGSNNFGIVTGFVFKVFDIGNIWGGGQNVYPMSTAPQHLDAIYNFTQNPEPDAHATIIPSFALYQGSVIVNQGLYYTKPVENPAAFEEFLAIKPILHSTSGLKTVGAAVAEQTGLNKHGHRQALTTTTFVNNRQALQYALDVWKESVPVVEEVPGVAWALTFHPLTQAVTQKAHETGGNVLGLEGAPPLIVMLVSLTWNETKDDNLILGKALNIIADVERYNESKRLSHRFRYINYAWSTQNLVDSYGAENTAFMREVSRKYDPTGLFQTGLGGGFQLF